MTTNTNDTNTVRRAREELADAGIDDNDAAEVLDLLADLEGLL